MQIILYRFITSLKMLKTYNVKVHFEQAILGRIGGRNYNADNVYNVIKVTKHHVNLSAICI